MENKTRRLRDYAAIYFKGMAMGAADVVPGVSGGTIALIAGIYEELIGSIAAIKPQLWQLWKKQGFVALWRTINGNFLCALLAGIVSAIFLLAGIIKYLLLQQPVMIWAFFFGLVAASIWFLYRSIAQWDAKKIMTAAIACIAALIIVYLPPAAAADISLAYLFFCAMLAICAMILPGISGSFILVLLGTYEFVIGAVHDKNLTVIAVFIGGACIGLLSFAQILKYLFAHYHDITLAALTGFIIGSLAKIQPWAHMPAEAGWFMQSIVPLFFIALGAGAVLTLEYLGKRYR